MIKNTLYNNHLSKRVLVYILLCSVALSVVSTAIQLYFNFQDDVYELSQRFDNIEDSYIQSISTSLWDFNEGLVQQQLQGIVKLPHIRFVKIITGFDKSYQYGDENAPINKTVRYPIFYGDSDIGTLIVSADYLDIYEHIKQRAWLIGSLEFIKIFIVALCIVFIVHRFITRHISVVTKYSQNLASDNLDDALVLPGRSQKKDELDYLVDAINDMRLTIKSDIVKLEHAENALINLNAELEVKVYDRTSKLAESNNQLQQSLDDLTLAKDSLVQSEKMASLGQLVAGVAHEVNTPLGICVTSTSALKDKVEELIVVMDSEKLTKSMLSKSLKLFVEYQDIIERSLNKAVDLIRGFKSVAVEQHTDPELDINLLQHVKDIVNTVQTVFKRKKYQINIDIDENLNLVTFPSAWNQIITNFLMNSHLHGFEGREYGEINITFTHSNGYLTLLYKDNGKGVDDKIKSRIFEPFITTKRGQGGSGLGMNIVFNLVSSQLGGIIKLVDLENEQGCAFQVKVPIQYAKERHTL
jgi:signal transduction histidine kinase